MSTERLDQIEALLLQLSTAAVRHDNQLSRLEQLVQSNAQAIEANAQAIATQRQAHDELIRDAVEWFGDFSEKFERDHDAIVEMQSEIRGLQTESRRILERLDRGSNGTA